MKQIVLFLTCFILLAACEKNEDYIHENPVSLGDIKLISLRADHKTLLPDGKAKMQFYVNAYGIKELPNYSVTNVGDTMKYIPGIVCDTFEIPADIIPAGAIRLFDEEGKEYPDFSYSTTDTRERTISFYAQSGELESERLTIQIRKLPEENYEELVFPVIFHVLNPAMQVGTPVYKITAEVVQRNIERLNNVFNGLISTDPNGGNVRIRFEAAKYDPAGIKLSDPGIHRWDISAEEYFEDIDEFETYILGKKGYLIYNYQHYLNIWLINFKGSSFSVRVPTVIQAGESIPGLGAKEWPLEETFPEKPRDVGFFINMSAFLNPMSSSDFFEISNPMAQFFGLLTTQVSENQGITNLRDGDTDYCPDTYYYWNDNQSIFKNTSKEEKPDKDAEYFTSYNIMDRYSKKTSISVDQVARIRAHIEKCPSRWMYKSKYPFTGKQEDWEAIN